MRNIYLILILISNWQTGFCQKMIVQSIYGNVVDKYSQTGIPGANIILPGTDPLLGGISDVDGNFRIDGAPVGRIALQVSSMGYNTVTFSNLLISGGKEFYIRIEMEEMIITTEDVIITPDKRKDQAENKMAPVSARLISVDDATRYAGSLGDPSRMISNYAGIMTNNDSRNDILIRGNSPMGVLWRIDGVDIPNPNHFGALGTTGGPLSIVNMNLLANSDFLTGAMPSEYGNALSGAVDLKLRNGNNNKREFTTQLAYNGFEFGTEGPFRKVDSIPNKASYIIHYRYSTLAAFYAMGLDLTRSDRVNFGTGNSIPEFQDLSFKIDIPGKKLGRITLFGMGGNSSINLNYREKEDGDLSYGLLGTNTTFGAAMGATGLTYLHFFSENTSLKSILSVTGTRSYTIMDSLATDTSGGTNREYDYAAYRSDFKEVKYAFSQRLKRKVNAKNTWEAGYALELFRPDFSDSTYEHSQQSFVTNTKASGELFLLQGFGQWLHRHTDDFSIISGLHYQWFTLNGRMALEPRLGMNRKLNGNSNINVGAGLFSQLQPHMNYYTITYLPNGSTAKTNENIDFTKSLHFVLGYDVLVRENLRMKAEVYYQYIFNAPVKSSIPQFSLLNEGNYYAVQLYDSLENKGTGENYGLELTLERFYDKGWYFLFTASVFESKYTGYDKVKRNTAFNGNYVCNGLAGYEIELGRRHSLSISGKGVWAGGNRYIPIDLEASAAVNETVYDWSEAYMQRYDDYFRIDIRIGIKINGKCSNREYGIDLQNVTNHKNIFQQTYNPNTGKMSTDYQQGFFPLVNYRMQF